MNPITRQLYNRISELVSHDFLAFRHIYVRYARHKDDKCRICPLRRALQDITRDNLRSPELIDSPLIDWKLMTQCAIEDLDTRNNLVPR